jgi:hypothetical protein
MSKFGTKDTKVSEGKKYLQPGINTVVIDEIDGEAPSGKSPYLDLKFKSKDDGDGNVRLYMSDAAMPKSLEKLKHMASVIIGNDSIDAIEADTIQDYSKKLTVALKNKPFRMKFTGKQTVGNNEQIYTNISIGLPIFAEKLEVNPTKLKYDENNSYDLEKIETATNKDIEKFTDNNTSNDDDIF